MTIEDTRRVLDEDEDGLTNIANVSNPWSLVQRLNRRVKDLRELSATNERIIERQAHIIAQQETIIDIMENTNKTLKEIGSIREDTINTLTELVATYDRISAGKDSIINTAGIVIALLIISGILILVF